MSDVKEILARNIRMRRNGLGMSQEDLSGVANIDRTYVSGVERAKRNPTITVLARFAEALKTTPSALLDERLLEDAAVPKNEG